MKKCSTSPIIREMLIKTAMRCYFTLFRMAIINVSPNNKWQRRCGGKRTLLHCLWECKLIQPLRRTVWRFLEKINKELPKINKYKTAICSSNPTPGYRSVENHYPKKYMHPNIRYSTIYNSQDREVT